jgi:hypothetical protein
MQRCSTLWGSLQPRRPRRHHTLPPRLSPQRWRPRSRSPNSEQSVVASHSGQESRLSKSPAAAQSERWGHEKKINRIPQSGNGSKESHDPREGRRGGAVVDGERGAVVDGETEKGERSWTEKRDGDAKLLDSS